MPYIGNSPGTGTRNRFIFTATASQTTFSGADDNGKTLAYSDGDYVDVYLNGICLVPVDDYAATSKTSIVLTVGAAASDTLEVVAYDIATIADTVSKANGGTFEGDIKISTTSGPQLSIQDSDNGFDATTFQVENGGRDLDITVPQDIIFTSGSDEAMRILSGGNVGIGTSSPPSILSLEEETSNTTTRSDMLRLTAKSSGTTGVGFGSNIQFVGERTNGTLQGMGRIGFGASTNTSSDLSSDFIIAPATGGVPTEKVRVLAGGGITFNGDTAAANALDDYEEGTWTPTTVNNGFGSTPSAYTSAVYRKVGRIVYASCRIELSSTSYLSGSYHRIGGLPFNSSHISTQILYGSGAISGNGQGGKGWLATGSTSPYLYAPANTVAAADWDFTITYLTSS